MSPARPGESRIARRRDYDERRGDGIVTTSAGDVVASLLERGDELTALDDLFAAVATGAAQGTVIEGPAGMGKTALLDAAQALAQAHGLVVLQARASELERQFAYGVVRQLLEPALARLDASAQADLFEGAARPAALVLGAEQATADDTSFGVLHGLYWLVVGMTATAPVALFVDDVQWADRPSLRFLVHLARRLEGMQAAGVVVTLRTAEPGTGDELLDDLRSAPRSRSVRPGPLSERAVAVAVRTDRSQRVDDDFCRACHHASGGNPLYLRELLRAIDAEGVVPTREGVERVASVWPESIARHVLRRVTRVGKGATELAHAMAVLGNGGRLRHAAALTGVEHVGALARSLREMEILDQEEPFRFLHPVVLGAVYADLTPDKRENLHLQAARLLLEDGADDDRIAAHLLSAAPGDKAWCVEALRAAARKAIARGAPEIAATYLRRAVSEHPRVDEGSVPLLRELGIAEERSADAGAVEHLQEAQALCGDPRLRAEIALDLARTLKTRGLEVEAVEVIRASLASGDDLHDPELHHRLDAALISAAAADARGVDRDALETFERLLSDLPDGPAGQVVLAFAAAGATWMGAPADSAAAVAEQAIARGLLEGEHWDAIGAALWALIVCERYDTVAAHLANLRDAVQRRGQARGFVTVLELEASRAERVGSLAEAESSARLGLEIAEQSRLAVGSMSWTICSLVEALVARGDQAGAEAALLHMPAGEWPPHQGCLQTRAARGRLRLAQGRPDEALVDFVEVGRQNRDWPGFALQGPSPSHWRSSAALAQQQLGNADEARRLAGEEVSSARDFAAPRALGIALRVAGMVAPTDEALPLLHESVDVLRDSGAALERARAHTALGAAMRRRGQRSGAREPLREALHLARRCGATPLGDFVHQELLAAGARPRRDALVGLDALTASERRVAGLAAEGRTNRQLAQSLYLSPKTVEMHLSHVYQKLEITSRKELPAALLTG